MINALENFYKMLALPGVYAVFYHCSYGFCHEGKTYLVPVDAIPPTALLIRVSFTTCYWSNSNVHDLAIRVDKSQVLPIAMAMGN